MMHLIYIFEGKPIWQGMVTNSFPLPLKNEDIAIGDNIYTVINRVWELKPTQECSWEMGVAIQLKRF